jgi:hypothetical protein
MYSLEYSLKQDCFHIDKLENTLRINLTNYVNAIENEYTILLVNKEYDFVYKSMEFLRDEKESKPLSELLKELNINQ